MLWLLGIARGVLANQARGQRRWARLLLRVAVHTDPSPRNDQYDEGDEVGAAIAELSAADQEVLRLAYWDDLSRREIAALLGVPVGTVDTRLHRARQRLRERLTNSDAYAAAVAAAACGMGRTAMLSDDRLNQLLRGSDPVGSEGRRTLTDPDGPAAIRLLAGARRRLQRRRVRRIALVPAVAVVLAGATAATQAWIAGDGEGHALDTIAVDCVQGDRADASVDFDILSETPVEACQRQWQDAFGEPAPSPLVACVDSSFQGSIKVYPGGVEVCARHRADPYAGATPEQLRLAQFQADLADRFAGETCVTYADLRAAIGELLAEHELTGWTVDRHQTLQPRPEGPCAEVSQYDEPDRTIWLTDHRAGDPYSWQ